MPMMPARRCGGCGQLVTTARCPTCVHESDQRRGSAATRGYGARWRDYSRAFRMNYPLCGMRGEGAPMTADSVCLRERRVSPATLVDHIVQVSGPGDPRFFDPSNHQSLCDLCHNLKRQRESSAGDSHITSERDVRDRVPGTYSDSQLGEPAIG